METSGWIWPNFKLIQALMYVIITCKYEKDPIKKSREKVETSKLSCMSSLPATMKRIRSRTAEKKWRHPFSHYKPMGIFSDAQGQLTTQSVVQSSRNSNSSELSCMLSLPASMKRIGLKTAEKKWRHRFLHYNPMGAFCCHGNQSSDLIWPKT